jgi:ATP-dependent DNA helicase RecG
VYLNTDIQYLKGVGPKLATLFHRRQINTIKDLLEYYPRAYEDRRAARNVSSLRPNEQVTFRGQILAVRGIPLGRTGRKMYDVVVGDQTGLVHCRFFRSPFRGYFEKLEKGTQIRVSGKTQEYRGQLELHHPDLRPIEQEDNEMTDTVSPIYVEIETLSSAKIAKFVRTAFKETKEWPDDLLPEKVRKKHQLMTYRDALTMIHFPTPEASKALSERTSEAHRRLIFEEFFWLELALLSRRSGLMEAKAHRMNGEPRLSQGLTENLPFALTGAQKRVIQEIQSDLVSGRPMLRLVQGDVGSGKTMVSFFASVKVIESGFQVALMVPTEILAEQHFKNASRILNALGIRIALLVGKTKASERVELLAKLKSGEIDLLIGTHALIEDEVKFARLGLAIIDEQHRFGVSQRAQLLSKGQAPHLLIMTATPIPRTLAITVYGDLDVSIIDELPKGRQQIQTRVIQENKKPQALSFMAEQVAKGRQAYVVYPLVEESEKIDLKDAVTEFERLKADFPQIRFGLLHGKMKPAEKDQVMDSFRNGEIQVLVSTTVIEVGVDVPNANLMMIEHAERFGLSQLHQLRGRVGRGEYKSFCILVCSYAVSEEGRRRTQMMEESSDGFRIAEFDLELRGPGEFMGTKQSGLTGFKIASLVRDQKLLFEARAAATALLQNDRKMELPENKPLRRAIEKVTESLH